MTDAHTPALLFLPGASGNTALWRPVADGLAHQGERNFFGWPGFGETPPEPDVAGIDDLVRRVAARVSGPVDLLAQSMGGVIALRVALEKPALVRHLVLSVTSGGLDVAALGARDDLSDRLPEIGTPTLLLWGDADPISPVAVGRRLAERLPHARLVVIPGGTHDLVHERAAEVLPHIEAHLAR